MTQRKKLRVAVLYGGRSGEHEVSLRSAASVIKHLDRDQYEIVPVGIDKQGRWYLNDVSLIENAARSVQSTLPAVMEKHPVTILPSPESVASHSLTALAPADASAPFDVVFPVMHGTFAEDGTIQGLLEMAQVPYVGAGILGSAVGMDKEVAKRLARDAGIPIVPYVCARKETWKRDSATLLQRITTELGFPCFVKPVNAGSSVGVYKVKEASGLLPAIQGAFQYDTKILIEQGIDAREIEVSILENIEGGEPLASIPGEIQPHHEFYSYEAKYLDENGASLLIPAKLSAREVHQVQAIAIRIFQVLELEGMARVDFFMSHSTGEIYFNEVNTLPGFTSISMYPKMWEASGLSYSALLTKLIDLALARHKRRAELVREFKPN